MEQRRERQAKLFDFRTEPRRQRRRRQRTSLAVIAIGLMSGTSLGFAIIAWPSISASVAAAGSLPEFAVCGTIRRTCVVDGDTIWLEGGEDPDGRHRHTRDFRADVRLGIRAGNQGAEPPVVLLNEGPFEVVPIGGRDEDSYGRKLRVLTRSGRSIGDRLVSEGLARTWTGRREPWC